MLVPRHLQQAPTPCLAGSCILRPEVQAATDAFAAKCLQPSLSIASFMQCCSASTFLHPAAATVQGVNSIHDICITGIAGQVCLHV